METESRQAIELGRIEADSRENRVGQQDLDHIIAFSTLHKHFSGTHMAVRVSVVVLCWVITNLASQYQPKGQQQPNSSQVQRARHSKRTADEE